MRYNMYPAMRSDPNNLEGKIVDPQLAEGAITQLYMKRAKEEQIMEENREGASYSSLFGLTGLIAGIGILKMNISYLLNYLKLNGTVTLKEDILNTFLLPQFTYSMLSFIAIGLGFWLLREVQNYSHIAETAQKKVEGIDTMIADCREIELKHSEQPKPNPFMRFLRSL